MKSSLYLVYNRVLSDYSRANLDFNLGHGLVTHKSTFLIPCLVKRPVRNSSRMFRFRSIEMPL